MINAGMFDKRIVIQSKSNETDADGYATDIWADVMSAWAMVKPVSARDYVSAMATQSENITRFVIRYREGLDSDMRIEYKNRTFEIISILNDNEDNTTLTLVGREVIL